jgi:predicted RNase H-like HicB family nuclease
MVSYAVELATRYDGLVMASFPDLPGVTGLGRDDEEALAEAREALAEALRACAAEGSAPPEPMAAGPTRIGAPLILPLPAL